MLKLRRADEKSVLNLVAKLDALNLTQVESYLTVGDNNVISYEVLSN